MRGIDFRPRRLIQNPDIQRLLRQRLDIKGASSAPTIAPELQGVIITADLTKDPSQALTRPSYMAGGTQAAVAAQAGYLELTNPSGSGVLVRIRRCIVSNQVGGSVFRLGFITSGNSANVNGQSTDLVNHLGLSGLPKAQIRIQAQAALLPTMGAVACNNAGVAYFDFADGEWVIPPLSIPRGFYVEGGVNTDTAFTLLWTEEPLPAPISG